MVDYDPDKKEFYRFEEEKIAEYHVVFFDDYDEPSSRAWLRVEELDKFQDRDLKSVRTNGTKLKSRVTKAYKEACMAEKLTMEDRLLKYSFALTSTMVECKKGKLG